MLNQSPDFLPSIDPIKKSTEINQEAVNKAVNASTVARHGLQGVFEKFGKPLENSFDEGSKSKQTKNSSIQVNTGYRTISPAPVGSEFDTAGWNPDFKKGDTLVGVSQDRVESRKEDLEWEQTAIRNQNETLKSIVGQYDLLTQEISERQKLAIDFQSQYSSKFEDLWTGLANGDLKWIPDPRLKPGMDGPNILASTNGKINQDQVDQFNNLYRGANDLWKFVNNAQDYQSFIGRVRDNEFSRLGTYLEWEKNTKRSLQFAEDILASEKKYRYRYLMEGVDAEKKIDETTKAWKGIFGKKVDRNTVVEHYENTVDHLGALMTNLQTGVIKNEKDYIAHIEAIGASLSREEKLLFVGMIGTNLEARTYNSDIAKNGNLKKVPIWESMQSLAKSFGSNEAVPAGICSSIHIAVSKIAEQWGIPSGTLTVSNKGVGHVVSLLEIDGKKVISDYGKLYTAPTVEGLFDKYAVGNKGALIRNYITDTNGVVIGHLETPLSKGMRGEVLSRTNVDDFLSGGITEKNGTNVEWYNDRKAISGKYTFDNGFHIGAGYAKSTLISGVTADTKHASLGYTKQENIGNGWNFGGTAEIHAAQSNIQYDGKNNTGKTNILQAQGGLRLEKKIGNDVDFHTGVGLRSIGQGTHPTVDGFSNIGGLGTGVTGESGINLNVGGNVLVSPKTRISGEYGLESNRGPNVQSLKSSDLNPFKGNNYYQHELKVGINHELDGGNVVFGKGEIKKTPLSTEKTLGIGVESGSIKATLEQNQIRNTNIFGPTDQNIIRATIEGKISKNGGVFIGLQKGGTEGNKGQVGAKWTF